MTFKTRRNAWNKYEAGTVFLEPDGPHVVVSRTPEGLWTYTYGLRKLTPEECAVLEVLQS